MFKCNSVSCLNTLTTFISMMNFGFAAFWYILYLWYPELSLLGSVFRDGYLSYRGDITGIVQCLGIVVSNVLSVFICLLLALTYHPGPLSYLLKVLVEFSQSVKLF